MDIEIFQEIAKQEHSSDPLIQLLTASFVEESALFEMSGMQDGGAWRGTYVARRLACYLVGQKGELRKEELNRAIKILEENLYSLGPQREKDVPFAHHLLKILRFIEQNKKCQTLLKQVSRPESNSLADNLVRQTIALPIRQVLTDAETRRAVLSALFSFLRQNVGSCFATAPAILILDEEPLLFLMDCLELFATGSLKRVIEGVEMAVPLSVSTGNGELLRPFFLAQLGADPEKKLSKAPGIVTALESAGVKEGLEEKMRRALLDLERDPLEPLTPQELLRAFLLNHFALTEKEVEEAKNRPQAHAWGAFVAIPAAQKGKQGALTRFHAAYKSATESFKAITENPLLKAWEFTLASFAETKADFTRWNLYSSLGMEAEKEHGIGRAIYEVIEQELRKINEELKAYESRYDHVAAQLTSVESRARHAGTEKEMSWLQTEYQMRKFELGRILAERDEMYELGRRIGSLLPQLVRFYTEKFQVFFQEVYDAEMQGLMPNPYEDSPAGFRLLYKHGRSHPAAWTLIHSPEEYQQALTHFFTLTEAEISRSPQFERLSSILSRLTFAVLATVRSDEFLVSSFYRLAQAYNEPLPEAPLENLDRIKRKPWAYISGGTMGTLVASYYGRSAQPTAKTLWIESPTELLAFFLDTAKELPLAVQKEIKKEPSKSLLAHSPTHAFLFKPGLPAFRKGWDGQEVYTYTWIRDAWALPQKRFLSEHPLSSLALQALGERVATLLPGYGDLIDQITRKMPANMLLPEFREHLLKELFYEKWLQHPVRQRRLTEEVDGLLYRLHPLFPDHLLKKRLEALFAACPELDPSLRERAFAKWELIESRVPKHTQISAEELLLYAKDLLLAAGGKTRTAQCVHELLLQAMRREGLCYPEPLLFADTNWVATYFGFTVSPGTGEIELWRFDPFGQRGVPMLEWLPYLNGTDKRPWGIYTNPYEYRKE